MAADMDTPAPTNIEELRLLEEPTACLQGIACMPQRNSISLVPPHLHLVPQVHEYSIDTASNCAIATERVRF